MRHHCFTPALHLMHVHKWQVSRFHFSGEKCIYGLPVVPGAPPPPPQLYLIPLKCIIADQRACDALVWCVKDFFQRGGGSRRGGSNATPLVSCAIFVHGLDGGGRCLFTGVFLCERQRARSRGSASGPADRRVAQKAT